MRGHVTPAATVATLRGGVDDALGVDTGALRLARCLRCDLWIAHERPSVADHAVASVLPPLDQLPRPRRGKALDDAVLMRLIAIDRGLHALIFGAIAVAIVFVRGRITTWQSGARQLTDDLTSVVSTTGRDPSRDWLVNQLQKVAGFHGDVLRVLLMTAVVYAFVEGAEAIGLWLERRWAEYLTVVATAGFLPFEIREIAHRASVLRVGALIVNLAVLVWLVINKRLFGFRRPTTANTGTE